MEAPFKALKSEYDALIARMTILPDREKELAAVGAALLKNKFIYQLVTNKTGVPVAFLMATAQREMSGNLNCYLGNGQSLRRVTTIVPKGRGPFMQPHPEDFIAGAVDALHIDGTDKITDWSLSRCAYEAENFNGWGYRSKGIPSPYVFGATSVQKPGKFIADHVYDPEKMDPQLGVVAIIKELFKLDKSLAFDASTSTPDAPEIKIVEGVPAGIGGDINVFLLQQRLNSLRVNGTPLKVDGLYGRATTSAVRAFQFIARLEVTGLVDAKTMAALGL